MSRHLKVWATLLALSLALPVLSWSQATAKNAPMPESDQTTNIPYFTLRDGMSSTLTLNNLAPTATKVTVTIFDMHGRAQALDPITVDSHSFKQIELKDVITSELFSAGNIQVSYHGQPMVVTCQLSVYSLEKRVSFESREQDMMDFESANLNGILSLPQKEARGSLAVTNVSKNKVTVQLTVASRTKEITLYSRETHLAKLDEEFGLHAPASALVRLSVDGLPGDVITTGFVMDQEHGYSSAFAMVDPKIMRSSHLAGAHFRFGQPDPSEGFPAGTRFRSPLLLANVSDKEVTAHVSVDYTVQEALKMTAIDPNAATEDKFNNVAVKDVTLTPGEVQRIELSRELQRLGVPTPVKETGVDISYDSEPGALIANLISVDQTGDYAFEVPVKDPSAMNEMIEGLYPWTLAGGANTVVHLKNTTDKNVKAMVTLSFAGGSYYVPDRISLQPYQTVAIDIQKLKNSKKPDVRGHIFPADVTSGQVMWHEVTPYTMIGRAEEVNTHAGIARSFSCGSICCGNYSESYYLSPDSPGGLLGDTGPSLTGSMGGTNCYGYPMGPYAATADSWWSNAPGIASIDSSGNVSYVSGGETDVAASFLGTYYYMSCDNTCSCTYDNTEFDATSHVFVGVSTHRTNFISEGKQGSNCPYMLYCPNGNTNNACGAQYYTQYNNPGTCYNYAATYYVGYTDGGGLHCFPVGYTFYSTAPLSCY